jgi:murein DD-endopeptidase MepM/ murein hydrolase activator NlpD
MPDDSHTDDTSPISPADWGPGYRLWQAFCVLLRQRGPEGTTSLVRMASHFVVILVAVLVLWFSRVQLPHWEIAEARAEGPTQPAAAEPLANNDDYAPSLDGLARAAVPFTLIPERPRIEIITHTVQPGDTLYDIAGKYNISAETVMWANGMELNPDLLRLGQGLAILPVDGILHTVEKNDTVEGVAKKYKATAAAIVNFEWNGLNPRQPVLQVGQKIIVPAGKKDPVVRQVQIYSGPVPAGARRGSGRFVWPASGSITQGYKPLHQGIDIGAWTGSQVKASDSGYVALAGWSDYGYGYYVVLDHGNGFQTLYAHLSRYFVNAGESVGQGAVIGLVGSTGNSTGPHLHFEIRQNGVNRNPFGFLP